MRKFHSESEYCNSKKTIKVNDTVLSRTAIWIIHSSLEMDTFSCFLGLEPKLVDPLWFSVDRPCDEEAEILQMEQELQAQLEAIATKDQDVVPLGKNAAEHMDEMEEEEEEEDNDDEDSDSRGEDEEEEEIEMDLTYDHDSPVDGFH